MTKYKYIVWVGGSEIGHYDCEADANEVADEWKREGYDDVCIDELEEEEV